MFVGKPIGMLKLCICLVATHDAAVAKIMMYVPGVVGHMIHTRSPDFFFVSDNRNNASRESTQTIEDK